LSFFFKIFIYPFLFLLSLAPFWILNGLSRFLYVIAYQLIGYRKSVVRSNLEKSFPEKSVAERTKIEKEFYKHFCDLIFENLKLFSITNQQFKKYCYFTPQAIDLFNRFHQQPTNAILALGHNGNWEWSLIAHQLNYQHKIIGIYHPLSSKNMDALISKLRDRGLVELVAMQNAFRFLIGYQPKNKPGSIGLIADQTPPKESSFWLDFLNQDTPFFGGPEKIAKKFNLPVLFIAMRKVKRNTYELDAELITDQPANEPAGEITIRYVKYLEALIREQPEYWLWSHRRWKHKRPIEN